MSDKYSHWINALICAGYQDFGPLSSDSSNLFYRYYSFFKLRNDFFEDRFYIIWTRLCDFEGNTSGFFTNFLEENKNFFSYFIRALKNCACIPLFLASFFIINRDFSNCFNSLFTSATDVPEPLAILFRLGGPIIK